MKSQDKQILAMLQGFDSEMVLTAFELYKQGVNDRFLNVEKEFEASGWVEVKEKPTDREYFFFNSKYWVQTDETREQHIKTVVSAMKKKTTKLKNKKQSMDLNKTPMLCPVCQNKMYKQGICGGCSAGKAGYKIRLICENNPDHEVLL